MLNKSLLFVFVLVGGCSSAGSTIPIPEAGKDAVAIVNGVPITTVDVDIAMRRTQHGAELPAVASVVDRKAVIENLVNAELVRQAAVEKGLDKLPDNQGKFTALFAQYMAAQRAEMANLFFKHEVLAKATVSDEEARRHFDTHADQLRNEYHFLQIFIKKDEAAIVEVKQSLDGGTSFEDIVAKRFAGLPASAPRPWDLGFLRWSQLPAEWHESVDQLQPGQVSGIIKGAGQRFWVLKLVEKRRNENVSFETEKPIVVEMLQREKIEEGRVRVMDKLKASAKVTYPGGKE